MASSPSRALRRRLTLGGLLGGYAALLAFAQVVLPQCGDRAGLSPDELAWRRVQCLVVAETLAVGLLVPFLAARATSWRTGFLDALLGAAGLAIVSVAACAVSTAGRPPLGPFAWAQVFLLSFAMVLGGVVACLANGGLRPTNAQALTSALALAMVGSVFYANVAVEESTSAAGKTLATHSTLWANPWLIAGGSILQADPLRGERLYMWSRIPEYAFRYPASGSASAAMRALGPTAAYGGLAIALWALAWWLARRRRAPPSRAR